MSPTPCKYLCLFTSWSYSTSDDYHYHIEFHSAFYPWSLSPAQYSLHYLAGFWQWGTVWVVLYIVIQCYILPYSVTHCHTVLYIVVKCHLVYFVHYHISCSLPLFPNRNQWNFSVASNIWSDTWPTQVIFSSTIQSVLASLLNTGGKKCKELSQCACHFLPHIV